MGCMSHRRKNVEVRPEQKWDYICLCDFKSTSCFTPFAYGYLWLSLFISVAVYAIDIFTTVNILAFDRFFERFEDSLKLISRTAAKWIFTACIILSLVNLIYEYIRAWRIMKTGSVAECYLDNIAARLESTRFGKGQGWRRFLVFAELTKSKKGAEYVALFTYFSFQSWIRVLLCNGPRQAVNALVLYSFARSEFTITTDDTIQTGLLSIFDKIRAIAMEDYLQALILSGMLFTLVIWVFTFISLLIAFFLYVFFLWGWIPRADGGLSGYCERKINKRLMKVVSAKVNKAIAKEEQSRIRLELKNAKKNGEKPPEQQQATLPSIMGDKLPRMPTLQRSDTNLTSMTNPSLPAYTSRPVSPASTFELGKMSDTKQQPQQYNRPIPNRSNTNMSSAPSYMSKAGSVAGSERPMPNRSNTNMTNTTSYSSKTNLIGGAADMGYNIPPSPASSNSLDMRSPSRTMTNGSNRSHGPMTQSPLSRGPTTTPTPYSGGYSQDAPPMPPAPVRTLTNASSNSSFSRPSPRPTPGPQGQGPSPTRPAYVGQQSSYANEYASNGRASPAGSSYSQSSTQPSPRYPQQSQQQQQQGYGQAPRPLQPMRSATGPVPPRGPQYPPVRNMTAPVAPRERQDSNGSTEYGQDYGYNRPQQRERQGSNGSGGYERIQGSNERTEYSGYNNGGGYNEYDVESQRGGRY